MTLRLAILHYTAPPIIGGVEVTIRAHARLLADRGYVVEVVAGRGEQLDPRVGLRLFPEMDSTHPQVLEVNAELAEGVVSERFRQLEQDLTGRLFNALEGVDVCLAHNVATLHKNLALTSALRTVAAQGRPRLLAWCHDFAWDDPLYRPVLHDGPPWDLLRSPWPGVQYVAVSQARRDELARLLGLEPRAIAVVPPGVEPAELIGIRTQALGLVDGAPLLLLPGRITRRKNIELAIDITGALAAAGLNPKLAVMGPPGPHNPANAAYLEELKCRRDDLGLHDRVLFMQEYGAVDDDVRRELYWSADVLLLTSRREGFGIPMLEAGLTRLPIFCSDIQPFRETLGELGIYIALDEAPQAIAARIARFLEADRRYQWKRRVLVDYRWDTIMDERIEPLIRGDGPDA